MQSNDDLVDHMQMLRKLEDGEVTDHGAVKFMPFEEKGGPEVPEEDLPGDISAEKSP